MSKLKWFFREVKWKAQDVKFKLMDVKDAAKDFSNDVKQFKSDVRSDFKELKTDLKEMAKETSPKVGNAIEKIDRFGYTVKNATRAVKNATRVVPNVPKLVKGLKKAELKRGDHIFVIRVGYEHHALYVDDDEIIHYSEGRVRWGNLDEMDGFNLSKIQVKDSPRTYTTETVIERAKSRIGESDYNLALNNCEHFVIWCRSGGKTTDSM